MKPTAVLEPPPPTDAHPSIQEAVPSPEKSLPLIESLRQSFRKRFDRALGKFSPITSPLFRVTSAIGQGVRRIIKLFKKKEDIPSTPQTEASPPQKTDLAQQAVKAETYADKTPEVSLAYQTADKAEREHMDRMGRDYFALQNDYRVKLKNEHPDIKMDKPVLSLDDSGDNNLMDLAAQIAEEQATYGKLQHTLDQYRKKYGVDGEILTSDFSSHLQGLKNYLLSKKTHPQYVTGNFGDCGYAIRSGVEEKTGKKMYYLVVLYRHGRAQDEKPPLVDIPGGDQGPEAAKGSSVEECIGNRPHLKAHFDALDLEMKQDPELSYELNQKLTDNMQKREQTRGMFCITMRKGTKVQHYTVTDAPPTLMRSEMLGEKGKVLQVPFHMAIQDFEKVTSEKTPSAGELEEHRELPSKEASLKDDLEEEQKKQDSPSSEAPDLEALHFPPSGGKK